MLNRRNAIVGSAAGLAAAFGLVPSAFAQAIKKPVHLIIGFPAGGGKNAEA